LGARDLEQQLVERLGCVASAKVRCRLPNRVEIQIEEFDAPAVWESQGGLWWMSRTGKVLGRASEPGPRWVIHDTQGVAADPVGHIVGVPWQLAHDVAEALPAAKEFDYDPARGLVLRVTSQKWPVYLGQTGSAENKIALMRTLVDRLAREGLEVDYIDLRDEQRPTFKAH
jgi:cell division septal protein FtsQ